VVPDGSRIAFFSGTNDATNIFVVAADGTGTTQITNEATGYNEDPTWSPDGAMIAFWSDRGGDHEIWAMLADGSGLVNVSNTPGADENPSWAGRRAASRLSTSVSRNEDMVGVFPTISSFRDLTPLSLRETCPCALSAGRGWG